MKDVNISPKAVVRLFFLGFLILVGLIMFFSSFFVVESGTSKIVLTAGKATEVAQEGLNFKIPFYQSTHLVNIKTQKTEEKARAASKDLQTVSSIISVNYHYDKSKLIDIYRNTGFSVSENIIQPRIQETLKAVAARYTAPELITQRDKAKTDIDQILKRDLAKYNIIVEDVQLTEFMFSKGFNEAIESKQTEVQKTLEAQNRLERTQIEAKQRIAQAQGEAEAIRIQSEAVQKNGGSAYVALKWVEKWDGTMPKYVLGESSNIMIPIAEDK